MSTNKHINVGLYTDFRLGIGFLTSDWDWQIKRTLTAFLNGSATRINQYRNLRICTKHSTLGCITELTCSNPSNFNLFHLSFTFISLSPEVCIRIYPMPSDSKSVSISSPWPLSFDIPPKFLFALCLEIAEACKLILSVQSSYRLQCKPVVSHPFKTSTDRGLRWQANCRISTLT